MLRRLARSIVRVLSNKEMDIGVERHSILIWSTLLIRMHPKIRRDLAGFGQLDHVHGRRRRHPAGSAVTISLSARLSAQSFGPVALSSQYRVCSSVQPGTA